ncbi:hypothetical protein [Azospirillum sp. sgz301742]
MSEFEASVSTDTQAGDAGTGIEHTGGSTGGSYEGGNPGSLPEGYEMGDDGAPARKAPDAPSKYKVKVDGSEVEMTLEELQQHASLGKAAHQKMREAAEQRRQLEEVVLAIKNNPAAALKHLGVDPDAFAKHYLNEALLQQYEPEKYKALQEQRELEQFRKERELQARQAQQQQVMAARQADAQKLMGEISEAFNESNFVADDRARAFKAYHALRILAGDRIKAAREGRQPSMTVKDALVKTDSLMSNVYTKFLQTLPPEQLAASLGEETLKKIRQYEVQKIKSNQRGVPPAGQRNAGPVAPQRSEDKRPMSEAEWRDKMAKLRG